MGDHWEGLGGFMGKKKLGDMGGQVNFLIGFEGASIYVLPIYFGNVGEWKPSK